MKQMLFRCYPALRAISLSVLGLSLLSAAPQKSSKTAAPTAATVNATPQAAPETKSYVIGAEDVLMIGVWRDTEVSKQVVVRPDGKITLPLLGDIQAAGTTPEALTQVVYDGLSKLKTLDKSEVTVAVVQVNSKKYFINGEIIKPGAYPLLIPTTVLEALVNAGGFRDFADKKGIIVLRGSTRFKFNYQDVIRGKKMEQNILLQPGDQIIVPD
jgi:polysaccharide biosynthesis/export protein